VTVRRLVGAERARWAARFKAKYEAGASIRDLAEEAGRSYGFMNRLLVESGAAMRGRGGDQRSHIRSAERRAEIEALGAKLKDRYEDGASISELAEEAGFSEVHTYRLLVAAGTKIRRPAQCLGATSAARSCF
jgi:hypothetical protein